MSNLGGVIQLGVSILAIVLSAVSLAISVLAYRRSARLQDFEFKARLEIADEVARMATRSFPTAFHYTASLVNRGPKPVDVLRVIMDCGSKDQVEKREHHILYGRFTLPPGDKREVFFELSWKELDDLRRKLGVADCLFFLRVRIQGPSGEATEVGRSLGGVQGEGFLGVVPGGDLLTG